MFSFFLNSRPPLRIHQRYFGCSTFHGQAHLNIVLLPIVFKLQGCRQFLPRKLVKLLSPAHKCNGIVFPNDYPLIFLKFFTSPFCVFFIVSVTMWSESIPLWVLSCRFVSFSLFLLSRVTGRKFSGMVIHHQRTTDDWAHSQQSWLHLEFWELLIFIWLLLPIFSRVGPRHSQGLFFYCFFGWTCHHHTFNYCLAWNQTVSCFFLFFFQLCVHFFSGVCEHLTEVACQLICIFNTSLFFTNKMLTFTVTASSLHRHNRNDAK